MKKKMREFMVVCLEGFAVFVALLAGLAFFAHWKISHGGISLGFLKGELTGTLQERLEEGSEVSLDEIVLSRDRAEDAAAGAIKLYAQNLLVTGPDGQQLFQLPELAFNLRASDLLKGQIRPHFVEISGASISIKRLEDGSFDFGLTSPGTVGDANLVESILINRTQKPAAERLFEGAMLKNTSFLFTDEMTGKIWQTTNAMADVWRTDRGYASLLKASFLLGEQESYLEIASELNDQDREIVINLRAVATPVSEILTLLVGPEDGEKIQTELTGSLSFVIDYQGNFKGASVDVSADEGTVVFAGQEIAFDHVDLTSDYLVAQRSFDIDLLKYEISGNKGRFSGIVSLGAWSQGEPLAPTRISYDLQGRDVLIDLPGVFEQPLPLSKIDFAGEYMAPERVLCFESIAADFFGKMLSGDLDLLLPDEKGQSPGIRAQASFDGVLAWDEILRGWPLAIADGARGWVATNVISGKVTDLNFEMDMPRGAIQPATTIGEDSMLLTFSFEDAASYFVPGVTPLTGLSGDATLRGNSFQLTGTGGRVGGVKQVKGQVDMPKFYPKGSRGIFKVQIEGNVQDVLSVVDEEPLGYISKGGFSPDDFGGTGVFEFEITRPLLSNVAIDDYEFFGKGTFTDLSLDDAIATLDITNSTGVVEVSWDGLDVKAEGMVEGTPISFEYLREFTKTEDTLTRASGVINASSADSLGLSLRQFLHGDVAYSVEVSERDNAYERIQVTADLSDAEVRLDTIAWVKQKGVPGDATITIVPPGDTEDLDFWRLDDVRIDTQDLNLTGSVLLQPNGRFVRASVDKLSIKDRADLAVSITRDVEILRTDITGAYANVDFLMDGLTGGEKTGSGNESIKIPGAMQITVDLGELELKESVGLKGFEARLGHDGDGFKDVYLSGKFEDGGYVTATMAKTSDFDIGRQLQAQTDNLGALAKGIFGITSITAGRADYTGTFLKGGPVVGTFTADSFVISDAPLIARLLAAGSLTGLADLLGDEGIEFTSVVADVQMDDGIMSIVDARLTGPSLGVSIGGDVDLVLNDFDISGAMAPAYSVNSALGQLPGLGRLLVSREGEGIVAFAYGLNGPFSEPTVTVNTLSLFTPGIFRRIFEPVRARKKSTSELLDQAIEAAEMDSQLEFTTTAEQLQELEESLDAFLPQLPDIYGATAQDDPRPN